MAIKKANQKRDFFTIRYFFYPLIIFLVLIALSIVIQFDFHEKRDRPLVKDFDDEGRVQQKMVEDIPAKENLTIGEFAHLGSLGEDVLVGCIALVKRNPELCGLSEELESECLDDYYLTESFFNNDLQVCGLITHQNDSYQIYQQVCRAINEMDCSNVDESIRERCDILIRSLEEKKNLCSSINDSEKEDCENLYFLIQAFEENDSSICSLIPSDCDKAKCKALLNDDISFCTINGTEYC